MVVKETIDIDLDRIDTLIEEEEAKLEPKHRASIAYREVAERTIAGGVASSWQRFKAYVGLELRMTRHVCSIP